ncbi:YojF family protein [Paenibacillus sp.]|uniref:YojF family protein n=1 Tax=Paenibacillus sp. TaxID=58172 RepID=UPI002D28958C|nr:YojF family protein [Paenibacillus sp.]HZG86355.1 YojF family protein [Paenibacillus sp.]
MQLIAASEVQRRLDALRDQDVYMHLEMTTGAYAAHFDSQKHPAATFVSNAVIRYAHGSISGHGPYRVGLKTASGWVYSEGLTHYDETDPERLILAGHDGQGKLVVALQLSLQPF